MQEYWEQMALKEARSSMLVYADCCDVLFPDVILEGSVSVAALGVCGLI